MAFQLAIRNDIQRQFSLQRNQPEDMVAKWKPRLTEHNEAIFMLE
jgi:hypothetical protein